jgi:hypothetical protein
MQTSTTLEDFTHARNAGSLQPHPIAGPTLGEEKTQGHHHWDFAAGVRDASVWQLAFLPRAEAYCGATPTECLPFFGNAVSNGLLTRRARLVRPRNRESEVVRSSADLDRPPGMKRAIGRSAAGSF